MTEAEIAFLMEREFALTAADAVWRRTKSGLRMTSEEIGALDRYMQERRGAGETRRAAG